MRASAGLVGIALVALAAAGCKAKRRTETVVQPATPPSLTTVSPASGSTVGGLLVTLTGAGFQSGATVTFAGTAASSVTVTPPFSLTALTPAHAAGTITVTVFNPDGTYASLPAAFSYGAPAPSVNSATPANGPPGGGNAVTLAGQDFQAGATVMVGALAATVTSFAANQLVASMPAGQGVVSITVTNPDTQSATLTNGYTYDGGVLDASFGSGGVVTSNPGPQNDDPYAAVGDGTAIYVAGTDTPSGGSTQWRIEKRSGTSGALVPGFGNAGVVQSDPSSGQDIPFALLSDGTNLYVIGYDSSQGSADYQWRVEKHTLASGALVSGFGSAGAVTSNPSSGNDYAYGVGSDGTYLYVAGADRSPGSSYQGRIEKRSLATGALDTGFGTSGVVVVNPSSLDDEVRTVLCDGSSVFVIGWDLSVGAGDFQWRIEKRAQSDGSLVTGFGTSGVVTSNPSSGNDQPRAVLSDGTSLYVAGWDQGSGTRGRMEKRSLSTGALVTGFGTGGVVVSAGGAIHGLASDGTYLYLGASDAPAGDDQWRIEKRNQGNGALVATFGSSGIVTSNPTSGNDRVWTVVFDPTGLYVVGAEDAGSGDLLWRLEKRSR